MFLLGSGKVNLVAAADNDTVAARIIDGARQPAGTCGATGSGPPTLIIRTSLAAAHWRFPRSLSAFRITLGGSPTAGSACALTITAVGESRHRDDPGGSQLPFRGWPLPMMARQPTVMDKNGAGGDSGGGDNHFVC